MIERGMRKRAHEIKPPKKRAKNWSSVKQRREESRGILGAGGYKWLGQQKPRDGQEGDPPCGIVEDYMAHFFSAYCR